MRRVGITAATEALGPKALGHIRRAGVVARAAWLDAIFHAVCTARRHRQGIAGEVVIRGLASVPFADVFLQSTGLVRLWTPRDSMRK